MLRRLALDWDFKNNKQTIKYIKRIFKLSFYKLKIIPSKNKYHYHVFVWTYAKGKRNVLRKYLGCDKQQLFMDTTHLIGKQTMFNKKRKRK